MTLPKMFKPHRCMTCKYVIEPTNGDSFFSKADGEHDRKYWCMSCIIFGRVFRDEI